MGVSDALSINTILLKERDTVQAEFTDAVMKMHRLGNHIKEILDALNNNHIAVSRTSWIRI